MQSIKKIGISFMFQPDPVTIGATTTPFPWVDAGSLQTRTIKTDLGEDKVMDDRDGVAKPLTIPITKYDSVWDLETSNTGTALIQSYLRSLPAIAWTQSASTLTDIPHKAWPNSPVKLLDGATIPNPQYMVASITNVKVGASVCVRGVDYDYIPSDLERGLIYILPTSTLVTAANTSITITMVLTAVTAGKEMNALSGGCVIEGNGEMHYASCEGQIRAVDGFGRYSILVPEIVMPFDKVASTKLTVTKLSNAGGAYPNGRFLITKGFMG